MLLNCWKFWTIYKVGLANKYNQLWQRDSTRSAILRGGSLEGLRFAPVGPISAPLDSKWLYYNFAAVSFHTKKLYSRLCSTEIEFY